jgi:3'-phosphoadenosine 5'-phosphosulfate (PAPS) 3'-phosphatase
MLLFIVCISLITSENVVVGVVGKGEIVIMEDV